MTRLDKIIFLMVNCLSGGNIMNKKEAFSELAAGWAKQDLLYLKERRLNEFRRAVNRKAARFEKQRIKFDAGFDGKHIWG